MRRFATMGICAVLGAFAGQGFAAAAVVQRGGANEPLNFVEYRKGLSSAAQPAQAWLKTVKDRRFDLVINLAPPQSNGSIETEAALIGKQGITYLNIPVDFSKPTLEDFRFFSEVMKASSKQNVFVHCQANLRASSFVFLYRVIHEGVSVDEAAVALNQVWVPHPAWKQFITEVLRAYGKKAELF